VTSGAEEEVRKPSNRAGEDKYEKGDVAAGFADADAVVERTFTTPMVHQNSLETQSIVAQPNHLNGGMTIWSSTQAPFDVRKDVAEVLGVPEPTVRVIAMPVGGGFGGKFGLYETLVAATARRANTAVRLSLTRSEELLTTNPAPPTRIYIKAGAKRDGSLTALECKVTMDDGCYPFDLAGYVGYMIGNYYRFPNFHIEGLDVLTFKPSVGAYRAPGATSATFAIDAIMDELAEKLNLDSLKFRLQNACKPGDPLVNDRPWPSMGMSEVLEAVQTHPVWQNREAARAKGIGVGVAVGGWMGGVEPAAAVCALDRDGSLNIQVGSVDMSGTMTGFAVMAAEAFGIVSEQVRVNFLDTDSAPYSGGSGGSKVTYSTGAAVVAAAQEARRQALAIAADEMEASADDLEIVDGAIRVRGVPSKSIKLSEIASKTMQFGGKYAPVFAHGRSSETTRAPAFSAQLAEVEVDADTGEVKVHRLVVAQDVGRAINPLTIEGQMMGGAIQGWGWSLCEGMTYDSNGQLLNGTWLEYAMPNSTRTPSVETIIVEVPSDKGPYGVRGVGEAPVIPTAGAIANAIAHATGLRLTDLPMTPPRVLAALQNHSTD
jgi:CO/xanthine dehydrogenase Mo-binding subunit